MISWILSQVGTILTAALAEALALVLTAALAEALALAEDSLREGCSNEKATCFSDDCSGIDGGGRSGHGWRQRRS